jgi:hypothetical protein
MFRLRQPDPNNKFTEQLKLQALVGIVPQTLVHEVLAECGALAPRERKLSMEAVVWVLLAMNLFLDSSIGYVLEKLARGARLLWPDPDAPLPRAHALTYRRYQLGARPLVALFHRVCRPLATPDTPGAFYHGHRLLAVDGHTLTVPDTPANAAYFGRHRTARGAGAFPQVQGVYLVEVGTHAVVDAGFWPCHTSERRGARRLLRSLPADSLLLYDRGLHEYDLVAGAQARQAHVLGRLPATVKPVRDPRSSPLPDGSWLAWLQPTDRARRADGENVRVRVIEYTLDDPRRPGHQERHRLLTTLLDPRTAPALELVVLYHKRWEVEGTNDELETHQVGHFPTDTPLPVLRSRKPVGVFQELYSLLLAHYAVRTLMHEAALASGVSPDRVSFTRAVRVLTDATVEFQLAAPDLLPGLYRRLLKDLTRELLPPRRIRSNPRVVKRKMSNFPLKRVWHRQWPQPTRPFPETVVLI